MGNLCGKPSSSSSPPSKPTSDPFSRPGRTLGSAPSSTPQPSNPRAPIPQHQAQKIPSNNNNNNNNSGDGDGEAKSAAARAAEQRASQKPKGKLGKELERQRAQTMQGSLEEASREERRRRDVEGMEERRHFS